MKKFALDLETYVTKNNLIRVLFDENFEQVAHSKGYAATFGAKTSFVALTGYHKEHMNEPVRFIELARGPFFLQIERFDSYTVVSFIDVANFFRIMDEVNDQKLKHGFLSMAGRLNDLVANISHCVLNPAMIISGVTSLMSKEVGESQQKNINKILSALNRIVDFTNALNKIYLNSDDSEIRSLDDVIKEQFNLYAEEIRLNEIDVDYKSELDHAVLINSDVKFALGVCFLNALEEVLSSKNDRKIHIHLTEEGGEYTLSLIDSADGVKEADEGKLFVSSFTTKLDGKHSGTSLYMANHFLAQMGGRITYQRKDGVSYFSLLWPKKTVI